MSKMYLAMIGSTLLLGGFFLIGRGAMKDRWDVMGWAALLVALGFAVLDYVSGGHKVQALIGWFSDPSWRIVLAVLGALVLIFTLSRLALAGVCKITYEISRAWHRGALDEGQVRQDQADSQ
jgi:hypothetical protein